MKSVMIELRCVDNRQSAAVSSSSHSEDNYGFSSMFPAHSIDKVLADVYRSGNRQAFNVAFQKLGLDCANWAEPIYIDLTRKAAGDEERMLFLFFGRIGWPTLLPTNEDETFMKNTLREKENLHCGVSQVLGVSSMEESLFLQAFLNLSGSYFSERRFPGETTMSPFFLKSMTPSAFEVALHQKDGELASYISRLHCSASLLESIRDSLTGELVKMTTDVKS